MLLMPLRLAMKWALENGDGVAEKALTSLSGGGCSGGTDYLAHHQLACGDRASA